MTEKEAYIHQWIQEVSKPRDELGGFAACPYASNSKTLIVETPIDDIVPKSGYDVIVFIVEDFWRPTQVKNWVKVYNEKFTYYKFFEDISTENTHIGSIQTNNRKFNLILCQSKKKLSAIRKKLAETEYYSFWSKEYLEQILGEEVEIVDSQDISG